MRSSRSRRGTKRAPQEDLGRIEIDAAEALAQFSKSCLPEAPAPAPAPQLRWLTKRRRSSPTSRCSGMLRVVSNSAVDFPLKDEFQSSEESDKDSPGSGMPPVAYNRFETSDDSLDPVDSPSSPLPGYSGYVKNELGLVQHSAFKPALDFDDEKPSRNWGGKYRGKNDEGRRKRAPASAKPSVRSSKALLTEEEKELRRVRRIEANRESARQTIRRKQKMCEEMTCKANELSSENERIRKEIESVRAEMKRMSESSSSLQKQLEMANLCVPALTSSDGSGSDESSTPANLNSELSSVEPMILQQVQVNRQDDNIDSVEFSGAPALEPQKSSSESSSAAAPAPATGALNSFNNRPLQQVQGAPYNHPHFTFAKMMGGNAASRGFFQPNQQQAFYSFYPGKSIAAENRRRRKELKQTRLFSRQVTLNT